MVFMPESPRVLLTKGREEEALEVLQKLRKRKEVTKVIYQAKHPHMMQF